MRRFALLIIMTISLFLYGCGMRFDVQSKNNTSKKLTNVTIMFNNLDVGGGILIPHAQGTYLNANERTSIPKKALVKWTTPDGVNHSKYVEIKKNIPRVSGKITIIIAINEDNTVSVKWEKN